MLIDGETNTPLFVPFNNSSVEIAAEISWGEGGTSGTFDVADIQVASPAFGLQSDRHL